MDNILKLPVALAQKTARFGFVHPVYAVLISLAVLGVFAGLSWNVPIDNSYDAYFIKDDPSFKIYRDFQEQFGSDEFVYILYQGIEGSLFSSQTRSLVSELLDELEGVPFTAKIHSLENKQFVYGQDDALEVYPLEKLESIAGSGFDTEKFLLSKSYINGNLITSDGKYGAIFMEMNKSFLDTAENTEGYSRTVSEKVNAVVKKEKYAPLGMTVVGDPLINHVYNTLNSDESSKMTAYSIVLVLIMMWLMVRSFRRSVGVLIVVFLSLMAAMGMLGLLDQKITLLFVILPSLVLTLGVSSSVHLISAFNQAAAEKTDPVGSLMRAVEEVSIPNFLAMITTVLAFLSLLVAPIRAIREFAVYASFSVFCAFAATYLIIPAFLGSKKVGKTSSAQRNPGIWLRRFVYTPVVRFPRAILAGFLVLGILGIWGTFKLEFESNWIEEFSDKVPIKHAYLKVNDIIGGTGNFSLVLRGSKEKFLEPEFVRTIDDFQRFAESQPGVSKTISFADLVKDIHVSFNRNDESFRKVPDSRELISQYILAYEISGGEDLDDYLSPEGDVLQVSVRIKMGNTHELLGAFEAMDAWSKKHFQGYAPQMTGISSLSIKMVDYIEKGQVQGFVLAFILIALVMAVIFRSPIYTLLSLAPNLFPIIVVLGLMGWLGIKLDYVKMLIACITIGICVDDTIHFFVRFRSIYRKNGNYQESMAESIERVGFPMITTSVVLCIGFLVDVTSVMASLQAFGLLTALTIFCALASDLYLGPALILTFRPFGKGADGKVIPLNMNRDQKKLGS